MYIYGVRTLRWLTLAVVFGLGAARLEARNLPPFMSFSGDPQTSVTISWERDDPGRGTVRYGTTTNLGQAVTDGACRSRHVLTLTGLVPGNRYFYQVESTDGYTSDMYSFRTSPAATGGGHRVAFFADTQQPYQGTPATNHSRVVASITNQAPDFYVIVGDLVYSNDWSQWEDWFEREQELLARAPIMPVIGNHEYFFEDHDVAHYYNLFEVPEAPSNKRYYAYTYGRTRYIALNSENDVSGQNDWLARELQAAAYSPDIDWIIAYWHRTIYTWTEKHGRFQPAYENWVPPLAMYGADLVFSGHNHLYERSGPNRGAYYFTVGGGGGDPTGVSSPTYATVATTCYHHVQLDIDGTNLHMQAIRWDGVVFDELHLGHPGRIVRVDPAFPLPGQPFQVRYDAAQGPLAGSGEVSIHLGIDAFDSAVLDTPMTWDVAEAEWVYDGIVPSGAAERIAFVFHDESNRWHSNHSFGDPSEPLNWQALLGPYAAPTSPPAALPPIALEHTPVLSGDPEGADQNFPGDAMDLRTNGGTVATLALGLGFGDFGKVYANLDATNLYLGGTDLSLGGSNHVVILFLGVDALSGDARSLWHKTDKPNALDDLHNLVFTEPMDLAIVLGDEYGDGGAYTDFTYAGYNFGQGVYFIGMDSSTFDPVPGAWLSQFDGEGNQPTASADDDGDRRTERWECRIPWTALGASGPGEVLCLTMAGVIGSDGVSGPDRYLSSRVLGADAYGATDGLGNAGFNLLTVTPAPVPLPHADYAANGIPNHWTFRHYGDLVGAPADADGDGDEQTTFEEFLADTQPTNAASFFHAGIDSAAPPALAWTGAFGRQYEVIYQTNLLAGSPWTVLTNLPPGTGGMVRVPLDLSLDPVGAFSVRAGLPAGP